MASRRSTGGTRPALDYPALLSIPIIFDERIPKLINAAVLKYEERCARANSLLSQIDSLLLDKLGVKLEASARNEILTRMFRSSFCKMTGQRWDPLFYQGDIFHFIRETQYERPKLGSLKVRFQTGFPAGRGDQSDEEDSIIQIRPTNLSSDRELVFQRNVCIASTELQKRPSDVLQRGEVLFNNTNSQEQVGKTAYFDLVGKYFCSNHITRITTDANQLNPQFLGYVLNLYQRQRVFFKLCTNWNNQSGIGVEVLEQIPIPLPTPKRQVQIVHCLEKVRISAQELRRKAASELENTKSYIEDLILGQEGIA